MTDTNQANELHQLCKEVYERTGWEGVETYAVQNDDDDELFLVNNDNTNLGHNIYRVAYLYTTDYLLEKLPYTQSKKSTARTNRLYYLSIVAGHSTGGWLAGYHRIDNRRSESVPYWWGVRNIIVGEAGTPLKALLKLTLALPDEYISKGVNE